MSSMSAMVVTLLALAVCLMTAESRYTPDWASLDSRPMPAWYDEAKFGIFIHWGVWTVPAFGAKRESAFFWYFLNQSHNAESDFMARNYRPDFTYADFAPQFKAQFFDPNEWADLFKASGAKYIVLTSKHHEGFCNWPSKVSWNWNAMDVGPHRDLVGELATAIRNRTELHYGLYHSLFEWFNPLYLRDKASGYKTQDFVRDKTMPELYEIINAYKPDVLWSDGEWEASSAYWNSTNFLAWLYNDSPVKDIVVTNDRWGSDTMCRHGGYYTCNDKYNPGVLQKHKWENCMTLDNYSWGYRRDLAATDVLSMKDLTKTLVETISCGGNLLMNVGPTSDGTIAPIFQERLLEMGAWLKVNGEAVYSSQPWTHQNDSYNPNVWYTMRKFEAGPSVYAFVLDWPESGILVLQSPVPTGSTQVSMLGYKEGEISWFMEGGRMSVVLPLMNEKQRPCDYAWVLKFEHLAA